MGYRLGYRHGLSPGLSPWVVAEERLVTMRSNSRTHWCLNILSSRLTDFRAVSNTVSERPAIGEDIRGAPPRIEFSAAPLSLSVHESKTET